MFRTAVGDVPLRFDVEPAQSPGVMLRMGGARLEWTLERYFSGLESKLAELLDARFEITRGRAITTAKELATMAARGVIATIDELVAGPALRPGVREVGTVLEVGAGCGHGDWTKARVGGRNGGFRQRRHGGRF